jgi:Flp pilus assembly protein TadB
MSKVSADEENLKRQLEKIGGSKLTMNVSQEYIITTKDKVKLCLHEYLKNMETRHSWTTPLGILIAVIATLTTTTFRTAGFGAETWQAIFVISAVLSFVWLVYSLYKMPRAKTIEDLVKQLKEGT